METLELTETAAELATRPTPPRALNRGPSPIALVGLGVSIAFLYLFLRNVDWSALTASLAQAHYIYVLPALAVWFFGLWIRTLRWKLMVRHMKDVPMGRLLSAMSIGFMATNLLPARVGEIVRAAALARTERLKVSGVFATIVVERIFDVLSILVFMVLVLLYLPARGEDAATLQSLRMFGGLFAAVIAGAVLFLVLLRLYPARVKVALAPVLGRLPGGLAHHISAALDNFVEGLGMLSGWGEMAAISVLSLLLWLTIGMINWVLAFAFEIEISVLGACMIFVVTAFAIALPQAPSFIGVFHVAVETSLKLLHVGTVSAKSFAIVLWAISVLPSIFLGLWFLWRGGLSLGELTETRVS
ncbi:MAG: flippase-like domain-containing protein [Candidatus Wallbacteria bacterium]|nr:flippase-like domain-containing protein [Candidatus Wallbacteria bacterium]